LSISGSASRTGLHVGDAELEERGALDDALSASRILFTGQLDDEAAAPLICTTGSLVPNSSIRVRTTFSAR